MINEQEELTLTSLRERVRPYMSERRLNHTYAVEREVAAICKVFAVDMEYTLRAAALLHDITKELPIEKQLQLCIASDIIYTKEELMTPKIFHSRTAPFVIKRDFAELATNEILGAVRWHTTGRAGMTLCEQILFLADFIEDTRTFESCVTLRRFFWDGIEKADSDSERAAHLKDTMIYAFDLTIKELCEEKKPIHADTVAARNSFIFGRRVSG